MGLIREPGAGGNFWPHHEAAVAKLIPDLEAEPEALAMILGGSLARGWGRADSDIDGHLVITEQAMAARMERDDLVYPRCEQHCDYEGGYFDLKCVTSSMLEDAADRGSEPFRNSYVGAQVRWSRLDSPLDELLARVTAYPEADHAEKVLTFACHLEGNKWFAIEAQKRDDPYLMAWSAQRAALFAGRLILAHNRILFPYHKWLMRSVETASEKPSGFVEAMDAAVRSPGVETNHALADLALGFQDWGKPAVGWWNDFIRETEWAWRHGRCPVAER
ncbi:MAG: hypothetical protein AAF911_14900 [Planctomycetota bacterium]